MTSEFSSEHEINRNASASGHENRHDDVDVRASQLLSKQAIEMFAAWIETAKSDDVRIERSKRFGSVVASLGDIFDESERELRPGFDIYYDFIEQAAHIQKDENEWQVQGRAMFSALSESAANTQPSLSKIEASTLAGHIIDGNERTKSTTYAISAVRSHYNKIKQPVDPKLKHPISLLLHDHKGKKVNMVDDLYRQLSNPHSNISKSLLCETPEQARCIALGLIRYMYADVLDNYVEVEDQHTTSEGQPVLPGNDVIDIKRQEKVSGSMSPDDEGTEAEEDILNGEVQAAQHAPVSINDVKNDAETRSVSESDQRSRENKNIADVVHIHSKVTIEPRLDQERNTSTAVITMNDTSIKSIIDFDRQQLDELLEKQFRRAKDAGIMTSADRLLLKMRILGDDRTSADKLDEGTIDSLEKLRKIFNESEVALEPLLDDIFTRFVDKQTIQEISYEVTRNIVKTTQNKKGIGDKHVKAVISGIIKEIL